MLLGGAATGAALVWASPAVEAIRAAPAFAAGLSGAPDPTDGTTQSSFPYSLVVACCISDAETPRWWSFVALVANASIGIDCGATSYPVAFSPGSLQMALPLSGSQMTCTSITGGVLLEDGPDVTLSLPASTGLELSLDCSAVGGPAPYLIYSSSLALADGTCLLFPPLSPPTAGDQPSYPGVAEHTSPSGTLYAAVTSSTSSVFSCTYEVVSP